MIRVLLRGLVLAVCLPALAAPKPAEDGAQLEAEWGLGHESSSSPLVRVSEQGALVAVPGLSRLSGTVWRGSATASADGALEHGVRWAATALAESRRSTDAPSLGFRMALADLSLRWPLGSGTVGLGPSRLSMSVAGRAFRDTNAIHLDWTQVAADGTVQAWRLEKARYRHAPDFQDLDAEVLAPSASWQWAAPGLGLSKLDLGLGLRRERNRRGQRDLSNSGGHLMAELGWDALGTAWAVNLMVQRSVFDAAFDPNLPARRDTLVSVDLSAEWPLLDQLALRASAGLARNHARPWLFENRHRHTELALSGRW